MTVGEARDSLEHRPFRTADAIASGASVRALHSSRYLRPTRGVRADRACASLVEKARAFLEVLPPDAAFSHTTAAALHGLPLPPRVEGEGPLHVLRPITQAAVRRHGVVGHRAKHPRRLDVVNGLPVVGLADTWADLGELVGRGRPWGLDDLVIAGDAVASRLGTVRPLHAAVSARVRPRGKRTLLEALKEVRVGSASPSETRARLALVRAGIPEPRLNVPIHDDTGRLLAVGDLVWEERRVVGEYQGEEFHAADEQRARDALRSGRLRRAFWKVEEIWKADLDGEDSTRECVLRFARALDIPRRELRLTALTSRFFSTYAMEQALRRDDRHSGRTSF